MSSRHVILLQMDRCRPFFAGLLPEEQLRKVPMRQCQLSDGDEFGLLNEIGGECAGAVTLSNPALIRTANQMAFDLNLAAR